MIGVDVQSHFTRNYANSSRWDIEVKGLIQMASADIRLAGPGVGRSVHDLACVLKTGPALCMEYMELHAHRSAHNVKTAARAQQSCRGPLTRKYYKCDGL